MLEFYYDFLDKYFNRQDSELCYICADSFYLVMSGDSLDEIVKSGLRQCMKLTKSWLATDKFSKRTPGLFKPEYVGTRGLWLTDKPYLLQNQIKIGENKYNCKGVSKKRND